MPFLLLSCALLASAQDSARLIVHADTLDVRDLTYKADDSYLLDIVGRQSASIAAVRDSIERDSIEHARMVKSFPLTLPLLYQASAPIHLSDSNKSIWEKPYSARRECKRYLTTHHADLYTGVAKEFVPTIRQEFTDTALSTFELEIPTRALFKDPETERQNKIKAALSKKTFWYKELYTLLQFTQNYVSPNWYEGGNSSLAMYGRVKGYIKYDDKKRITWENTGEWNAGFTTIKGDSLRKVSVNEDLFRLYTKFGIKIVPKLYGSFTGEFRTTFMPTYKANTHTLKTGPFTPVRLNLAVGFDYKPINGLSIVFSPAAYKMVYARDTLHSPYTTYGLKKGENLLNEFGSSIRLEWKWKPVREVSLQTEFYFYTNYKGVETDLQVTCDFIVNRFITARLMLHPRYDSSAIADGDEKAKLQFKELISIGFAHKFY